MGDLKQRVICSSTSRTHPPETAANTVEKMVQPPEQVPGQRRYHTKAVQQLAGDGCRAEQRRRCSPHTEEFSSVSAKFCIEH